MDTAKLLTVIDQADTLRSEGKDGKDLALGLISWLRAQNESLPSIAQYLTSAGIPTLRGGVWRPSTVHAMLDQAGIERQQAVFPLQTIKLVVGLRLAGKSLNEIADELQKQTIATPKGGRWWPATVRYVIERAIEDERLPEAQRKQVADSHFEPSAPKAKKTGEKGKLRVPDDLVDRIVGMRNSLDNPMTMQQIADALNAEGIPTVRGGKRWYQTTVQSVLVRSSTDKS
jgi:3-deoxy-D-arabino-heptulosonate 7-phosphate (DAHP) synthase